MQFAFFDITRGRQAFKYTLKDCQISIKMCITYYFSLFRKQNKRGINIHSWFNNKIKQKYIVMWIIRFITSNQIHLTAIKEGLNLTSTYLGFDLILFFGQVVLRLNTLKYGLR